MTTVNMKPGVARGARGQRDWAKRKRAHGHRQQCDDFGGEGSIRELNGNGKKFNKKV